ncbi:hypothetical protein [Paenibacillus sp.]|uniref:hypothetical protein n=1 Tax=Paenibacillus sp. TaxID=58172 RepID=UPI002D3C67A9|nr:hypothetical protein [Paenibacillus sp.]HZG57057.1 hypothetical protein [Paenibacillus sp.]
MQDFRKEDGISTRRQAPIVWEYEGKTDFSSGTGAYGSEKALGLLSALIVPCFVLYLIWSKSVEWNTAQTVVALVLAFDISGGLVSNALNSCKRFYHTPAKKHEGKLGFVLKQPVIFSVFHIHPIVVGLMFGGWNWTFGIAWYVLFLTSVALVLMVPLYMKRPVSMLLIMLSVLVNLYAVPPVDGFEWLMPLLFIKIVYGHLVREEPYRK